MQNLLQPLHKNNARLKLTAIKLLLFSSTFCQLWCLFWVFTFSFIMSTFVPTDLCDYLSKHSSISNCVILLFSLPSCLARHSLELWWPENNHQAANAVSANLSDWSNPASCRADEFQTHQPLSLGHPLGYTSQAVRTKQNKTKKVRST